MSSGMKVLPGETQCIMGYLKKPLRILSISEATHVTPKGLVSTNNNGGNDDHNKGGAA